MVEWVGFLLGLIQDILELWKMRKNQNLWFFFETHNIRKNLIKTQKDINILFKISKIMNYSIVSSNEQIFMPYIYEIYIKLSQICHA